MLQARAFLFPNPSASSYSDNPNDWKEGNRLFFFPCHCPPLDPTHLNPGRNLSVSFTYHSKPLAVVRYAREPFSGLCQIPASYVHFPPSLPISQTSTQKGHFWCADSFPCPIHSRVCPWSLLHSLPRFTNTLAVLGHDQRLFIYGHLEAVIPPLPSLLAHTPSPLSCSCMEVAHYNVS